MGRVSGKVAFITGAARGQGRSHAVMLAREGADIIAVDACEDVATVGYPLATEADLAETARQVEALDRRIVARRADVRDLAALQAAVADGIAELGHIDIVVANAGIFGSAPAWELGEQQWQDVMDINLTGVWKTTRATIPHLLERGEGGSIILTSSIGGLIAFPNLAHYVSAKHGVTGLMRTLAVELAPQSIRVNSVHPTTVDTPMIANPASYAMLTGVDGATREEAAAVALSLSGLPVPWIEAQDVSQAVLYLASDEARYVTGIALPVDAGGTAPYRLPNSPAAAG